MSLIRRIACKGGSLKNGGSPSTISIIIIPNDQISTSGPYGNLKCTGCTGVFHVNERCDKENG